MTKVRGDGGDERNVTMIERPEVSRQGQAPAGGQKE